MISHRFYSILRRGTGLLPPRLRLRALTFIDCLIGSAEPENVYVPPLVPKQRRRVAVDVGANNGVTTCIMAGLFEQVHAFEANPRLAGELKTGVPANVQVHGVALSSQAGEAVLLLSAGGAQEALIPGTCHLVERDGTDEEAVISYATAAVTALRGDRTESNGVHCPS